MPDDRSIIDINDPLLQSEMVEANPEADFFELPAPPPDDRSYQVKILLGERGVVAKRQRRKSDTNGNATGAPFLLFALEPHIIDPGQSWDNAVLFDNATSIVMQSSGTSLLHAILRAVNAPALGRMDLAALRDHALGVFGGEPLCIVEGNWEAQFKDANGEYRTILKRMKNFPLIDPANPVLGHSPYADVIDLATRRPTGEQARAQFRITKYYSG